MYRPYSVPIRALLSVLSLMAGCAVTPAFGVETNWQIDSADEWAAARASAEGLSVADGALVLEAESGNFRSVLQPIPEGQRLDTLTLRQSPLWQNWTAIEKVVPINLEDAPVFLSLGPGNYWIFGRYAAPEASDFVAEDASLPGFDIPLKTTPFANQFDAPGGLKASLGGYHAWQSRDMKNWVHHGPVTDRRAKWVTTAEYVDGKAYIYYDFPNDQDPHLIIDEDLTDGMPGQDMGMVFKDPSAGSDIAIIRDAEGQFHIIYEDWSPIDAAVHSWDSPLAGHAVSPTGRGGFAIQPPAVDVRTNPTGRFAKFPHPDWRRDDPANYPGEPVSRGERGYRWAVDGRVAFSEYEIHEPEQDAHGDWAAITVGDQHYLFGDFHPAGTHEPEDMKIAWFTSPDFGTPFEFCDAIGSGHPDPDIGFANGRFYLINQTDQDYVSPGPWVDSVEARIGIDTTGNGAVDYWTDWQLLQESYAPIDGFVKRVSREPATMDLKDLPNGKAFCFELRIADQATNKAAPILDAVTIRFAFAEE